MRRKSYRGIEAFLYSLDKDDKYIFMPKYWHFDPVSEIATQMNYKPHRVTVKLLRIRTRLQKYLKKEGMLS